MEGHEQPDGIKSSIKEKRCPNFAECSHHNINGHCHGCGQEYHVQGQLGGKQQGVRDSGEDKVYHRLEETDPTPRGPARASLL